MIIIIMLIQSNFCRTDAGVHAMCATGHVELANKYDSIYDSDSVLRWMNRYLTHCGHEIR